MFQKNGIKLDIDYGRLKEAMLLACQWLVDTAQVKTGNLTVEANSLKLMHKSWKGAIRGEYRVSDGTWDFFGPVWHTGQAIKALVQAYGIVQDEKLLEAARLGAGFIGGERISDGQDENYGLIFAYEDCGNHINTSGILETLDGLLTLSEAAGDMECLEWAKAAVKWIVSRAYMENQGLFRDIYTREKNSFQLPLESNRDMFKWQGRPLIDDGILLKMYRHTGEERYRSIFYETAERLLKEEEPAGNWIRFLPNFISMGLIHPRHAYWWGRPMLMAYRDSGCDRYLKCACRAGQWYVDAQRADGGLMRGTYRDFKTDSFGHCTSGIACASIMWYELWEATLDMHWIAPLEKALKYCMNMQMVNPGDPNLKGVILEKVLPPDGTDRSPYYIRDLGTIFFIQAAAMILRGGENNE